MTQEVMPMGALNEGQSPPSGIKKKFVPNQIDRRLMGISAMNPWDNMDSSPRKQMYAGHLGQMLVISGATERYFQTGMEREYGKYTFSTKMPANGTIIRVIDLYTENAGINSINLNPQRVAIYEKASNNEIGYINLTNYCSQHPYFGFEYKRKSAYGKLSPGQPIAEGEVFLDSPSITEHGGYKYGRECQIALLTDPAVSEDGIAISESCLKELRFKIYETRTVSWGKHMFALNLYGDDTRYKPFPDMGEAVRPDGLLMSLRAYDPLMAIAEQNVKALQEPDFGFDKGTYSASGGRVVNIRVHHDNQNTSGRTPEGQDDQPLKYDKARRIFYQNILDEYRRLFRERGKALRLTPQFHNLVVEAISVVGSNTTAPGEKINRLHRQSPLDDWHVTFVVEYEITPTIGFKLTGCHGNKGVICKIVKDADMPVDDAGNRAEIYMDPLSPWNRMNPGALMEIYLSASRRDLGFEIQRTLGIRHDDRDAMKKLSQLEITNPALVDRAWSRLMGFYQIVSPKQYQMFATGKYPQPRIVHLKSIIQKGIFIYYPPDNAPEVTDMVAELEAFYPSTYTPITYVGNSGRTIRTKNRVRIGHAYILLLEKTADDWSAVSSGTLQHFGVLSQVTSADKYSNPTHVQAIRANGEAEVRIMASYCGSYITACILDRNNNPVTHKHINRNILTADKPAAINFVVDRNKIPLGGAKPGQLVKHILECGGVRFAYKDVQ
jgi:RNA polymerase Rpb2, domain 6